MAFRCSPYHHQQRPLSRDRPTWSTCGSWRRTIPPPARLAKLEVGLRPYGLPLAEIVPLLAGLLSVPLPAERYAALT